MGPPSSAGPDGAAGGQPAGRARALDLPHVGDGVAVAQGEFLLQGGARLHLRPGPDAGTVQVTPQRADRFHTRDHAVGQRAVADVGRIKRQAAGRGPAQVVPDLHPPPLELLTFLFQALEVAGFAEAQGDARVAHPGGIAVGGRHLLRRAPDLVDFLFHLRVAGDHLIDVVDDQAQQFQQQHAGQGGAHDGQDHQIRFVDVHQGLGCRWRNGRAIAWKSTSRLYGQLTVNGS
ncbi:hypothetical protein [Nitrospirillum sp. BR 11163]|uniref:hypothetical protein n=1 Tax=Nitrospirillum sp. BR 11163 TaxID=3104323 RepID=UPI002B002B37|nr:hypothetical protein [Nitrospirillum sp. BR 11163]MEA1675681.1 hypothetical protein [Nitrospirillum sp. BR 11163]